MYFTDRGIEELEARRGEEDVAVAWLAERLRDFVNLNPEFDVAVDRLATWLARLDDEDEDLLLDTCGQLAIHLDFRSRCDISWSSNDLGTRHAGRTAGMARWTVSEPVNLDFDEITSAKVRVIGGSVAILTTDGIPTLNVESISGEPLQVIHEGGELTITYKDLSWDGVLKWLRPQRHTVRLTLMVPRKCVTQLGVVGATAVVSGISGRAAVRGVSGSVTLDGVSGEIEANTVSGTVEAQGLNGTVSFHSVSGDLTLADGWLERLDVNTVSGDITADVDLDPVGGVQVTTVSGAVTLRLPADVSTNVNMHSMSGDVRSEFSGLNQSSAVASHSVSGNLGAGSAHVSVSTMSGRIMLLRGPERDNAGNGMEMEGEAN